MDSPESKTILFVGKTKDCANVARQLGDRLLLAATCFAGAVFMKHTGSALLLVDGSDYCSIGTYGHRLEATRKRYAPMCENALRMGMVQKTAIILEISDFWATVLIADTQGSRIAICKFCNDGPDQEKGKQEKDYALIVSQVDGSSIASKPKGVPEG